MAEVDRHQIVYSGNASGDMVGHVVDVTPSGCEAAVRRRQRSNMEVLCSLRGAWQSERKE
jgi:fibrillarin-like rRNA methylase